MSADIRPYISEMRVEYREIEEEIFAPWTKVRRPDSPPNRYTDIVYRTPGDQRAFFSYVSELESVAMVANEMWDYLPDPVKEALIRLEVEQSKIST